MRPPVLRRRDLWRTTLQTLTECPRFGQSLVEFDPKAEAKLRKKLDLYLVPTVSLLYLFCFIDRANVGMNHHRHHQDSTAARSGR